MSLEYFLFCKKRYERIISNLESIIENYTDVDCIFIPTVGMEIDDKILLVHQMCQKNKHMEDFLKAHNEIKRIKLSCEEKIYQLCNHKFVDDYVDTSCESCQKITYCQLCELTKK